MVTLRHLSFDCPVASFPAAYTLISNREKKHAGGNG
jgi:hypothetical protein